MINDPDNYKFDNLRHNLEMAIRAGESYDGYNSEDVTDRLDTDEAIKLSNELVMFLFRHSFILKDTGYGNMQERIDKTISGILDNIAEDYAREIEKTGGL